LQAVLETESLESAVDLITNRISNAAAEGHAQIAGAPGSPLAAGAKPAAAPAAGGVAGAAAAKPGKASDEKVATLVSMGFSGEQARLALETQGDDVERAVEWLFAQN
jgi:hypothetical protein